MSGETASYDSNVSGAKIEPLESDQKANVPHDGTGSVGDDRDVAKGKIDPLANDKTTGTSTGEAAQSTKDQAAQQGQGILKSAQDTISNVANAVSETLSGGKK